MSNHPNNNSPTEMNRHSPPPSPGTPKPGLLNKMSTLFGGSSSINTRPKNTTMNRNSNSNSSNMMTSTHNNNNTTATEEIQPPSPLVDSLLLNDEYNTSRVDSVYSSVRSGHSGHYHNRAPINNYQATPRTVVLDNTIIHHPTPPSPPSPPSPPLHQQDTKPTLPSRRNERVSHSPPPVEHRVSPKKAQDVEARFELLLREYGPSSEHLNRVNNLTVEQKEMLLRSSKSPALMKKNSTFSHVTSSFSIKNTFRLKGKNSLSRLDKQFYESNTLFSTTAKAKTAPGRYRRSRNSLNEMYGKSSRSKLKSTPEYFVHLLRETHVRDLEDAEILDLRVFLRSVVASWTTEFLSLGGYEALANLFKQMKEAPKRCSNDDKILQHLGKCLKTIMAHQSMGMEIILTNPCALYHIRDILFGPAHKKQKQVYALDISTRSLLLNILCTLATLQTAPSSRSEYVHGYDVLRRLLLDRPTDHFEGGGDGDKKSKQHNLPFPITLKTDPQEILQLIMDNDPNGEDIGKDYQWDQNELKPRYTAWMRELQYTAEKHIETITFLSQVLNYDFRSAYRQIKMRQSSHDQGTSSEAENNNITVMTEDGVVEYIITHLRLIRTVVTKSPTSYTGQYDNREQEKMRLELMMSGFDKISRILLQCPHPIVRGSYMNYLQPLLNPCADISTLRSNPKEEVTPLQLPQSRESYPYETSIGGSTLIDGSISDEIGDEFEAIVSEGEDHVDIERVYHPNQWRDPESYDDIFQGDEYLDDHFNTTDEENDSSPE